MMLRCVSCKKTFKLRMPGDGRHPLLCADCAPERCMKCGCRFFVVTDYGETVDGFFCPHCGEGVKR